jgi:hypothetical protein
MPIEAEFVHQSVNERRMTESLSVMGKADEDEEDNDQPEPRVCNQRSNPGTLGGTRRPNLTGVYSCTSLPIAHKLQGTSSRVTQPSLRALTTASVRELTWSLLKMWLK